MKDNKIGPEYKSVFKCNNCNETVFYYKYPVESVVNGGILVCSADDCCFVDGTKPNDGDEMLCMYCGTRQDVHPKHLHDRK